MPRANGRAAPRARTFASATGSASTAIPTTKRCSVDQPQLCDSGGHWANNGAVCPFVCSAGTCAGVCKPGAHQCGAGNIPQTCDATGSLERRNGVHRCLRGRQLYRLQPRGDEVHRQSAHPVRLDGGVPKQRACLHDRVHQRRMHHVRPGRQAVQRRRNHRAAVRCIRQLARHSDLHHRVPTGACTVCTPGAKQCVGLQAADLRHQRQLDRRHACAHSCAAARVSAAAPALRATRSASAPSRSFATPRATGRTTARPAPSSARARASAADRAFPTPNDATGQPATPRLATQRGNWGGDQACMYVCATGNCTGTCAPGAKHAAAHTQQTCNTNGSWQDTTVCPFVCTGAGNLHRCVRPHHQAVLEDDSANVRRDRNLAKRNPVPLRLLTNGNCSGMCVPANHQCVGNTTADL